MYLTILLLYFLLPQMPPRARRTAALGLTITLIQLFAFRSSMRLGGDPFPPRSVMLPGGKTVVPTGVPTTTIDPCQGPAGEPASLGAAPRRQ